VYFYDKHDYQIFMKRTKTSVVLIVLEYVLFPTRIILFLCITICSTRIRDKDILICILNHHAWKPPWNFKINPRSFLKCYNPRASSVTVETIIIICQLTLKIRTVWKNVRLLHTSVVLFIEVEKTASLQSRGRFIVIIGNELYNANDTSVI
jgi:hypothetical protein